MPIMYIYNMRYIFTWLTNLTDIALRLMYKSDALNVRATHAY